MELHMPIFYGEISMEFFCSGKIDDSIEKYLLRDLQLVFDLDRSQSVIDLV
jgi:hypothetical protein